jgi:two-component system, CAI-1 autoinducer sensor kinase/phosphatase CqsS
MYSLLPALVSGLFFSYGIYVLIAKGITRLSTIFFLHCITTFFWQGTWAVLFQVRDPELAGVLIKLGYLFIIFLPTTLYHFFTEISGRQKEHRWVYASYGLAIVLASFNLLSNLFVDGYYDNFWGYYPKAGLLHPVHVLQTAVVVCRGLYITWQQKKKASADHRSRLRICIVSMLVYSLAGIDYLCNYGAVVYPPGVVFAAIGVGLLSIAITRYDLMQSFAVAATVAHEMRTPLATIGMQANAIAQHLPHLFEGYQRAVANGLIEGKIDPSVCELLIKMPQKIKHQIDRSNTMINMMLASARTEHLDTSDFAWHSIRSCTKEALDTYPFTPQERAKVSLITDDDFDFYGSDSLFVFVIFNLLKNSLYAINAANRGEICITIASGETSNRLLFTDTASGIAPMVLKRIFDTFYTTKQSAGAGIGLAFCRNAIRAFNGDMLCDSIEGRHTIFTLNFTPNVVATGHKASSLVSVNA